MPHGFDFATQNLGAREEFSHLARKQYLHPRKTAVLPKSCCIFSGFQRNELVPVRVAEGAMENQYIFIEEKININKK